MTTLQQAGVLRSLLCHHRNTKHVPGAASRVRSLHLALLAAPWSSTVASHGLCALSHALLMRGRCTCQRFPATLLSGLLPQEFDASNNALSGPLPVGWSNMTWLRSLQLSGNMLTGELAFGQITIATEPPMALWLSGARTSDLHTCSSWRALRVCASTLAGC